LPTEFGRIQELMYELNVGQVMTPNVVAVSPSDSMRHVKELLRLYRISGTPVVEGGKLVGIVSTEDVIRALDEHCIDAKVGDSMSRNVASIKAEDKLVEAVRTFGKLGFGRLPVVDDNGALIGILTPSDISGRLLTIMERRHRQEEAGKPTTSQVIDNLVSDETRVTLRYKIVAKDFKRAGEASSSIKRALQSLNIASDLVRRAAIIAYEGEMNLVIHSDGGFLSVEVSPEQLTVMNEDTGPGIEDVEKAMQRGFSTAPEWVREMGFGAGMGLSNMQNCADKFHFESELGKGTLMRAIIYLRGQR
jgi:CBS domain-containing protein/anti-sigma regulatory factor (Ser/Thr protein kinase)